MTSEAELIRSVEQVRRYYEHNAAAFERLGQGKASMHRAVRAPGVLTREQAFHYVDDLILANLPARVPHPTVVDLGCGVGASLIYMATRAPISGEGITISSAQAARAALLIEEAGLAARVRCREGNFLDLPDDLAGKADLAFSIEAFIHAPDVDGYFREAARTLRQGGTLVVCDDFLATSGAMTARSKRWLGEFRDGWQAQALVSVAQARAAASIHGLELVRDLDLTAHLQLRRPRDRFISAVVALGRHLQPTGLYWKSLVGGNALQWALTRGMLSYRLLVLHARDD